VNGINFAAAVGGEWRIFSWPLPIPTNHVNEGISTAINQLGFAALGVGGITSDESRPTELGDQIWVWEDNTWKDRYWLMDSDDPTHDATYNNRWWDSKRGRFADFQLEAGKAYFYRHVTNWHGGTNFTWTPQE
jgi:hypothetical protein